MRLVALLPRYLAAHRIDVFKMPPTPCTAVHAASDSILLIHAYGSQSSPNWTDLSTMCSRAKIKAIASTQFAFVTLTSCRAHTDPALTFSAVVFCSLAVLATVSVFRTSRLSAP